MKIIVENEKAVSTCPFCGGEAQLKENIECGGHGLFIRTYFVQCNDCGAKGPTMDTYGVKDDHIKNVQESAVKGWNTRVGE